MSDDSRPLSGMERAVLAAALISAGAGALPILGRISGPGGRRLSAEAAGLLALDQSARARRLAGLMAQACALEPAGAALIHPEWLAGQAGHNRHEGMAEAHAIMARLPCAQAGSIARGAWDAPPAAGAAMSAAGSAPPAGPDRHDVPAVLVWLRRTVHAELVDMPVRPHSGDGLLAAADLPLIAPERLQAGLGRLGRRQLAWALTAALPRDAAAVAAGLGEPESSRLIAELAVLAAADPAEQTRAHGPVRAAILRMSDLTPGTGELEWERAGARAIAPRVAAAGGDLARQIAQRLPRQVGQVVLAELLGPHREQPPEHGASVDALLACLPY